jgi:mono/diheme cytochrome c family protein
MIRASIATGGAGLASLAAFALGAAPAPAPIAGGEVQFERDVRPILEASCFACHGAEKDKAELRLDVRERAFAGAYAGTAPVIVPGKASESSLYMRLVSDDADERMPQKAPRLSEAQIDVLRRWIDEGAKWPDSAAGSEAKGVGHWAYAAPVRPTPPTVRDTSWVREPIDAFVLARLEREGLRPTPEAERATLLRRLALDLTGLPPSVAELEAFERDERPDAYPREVQRLLASPHFGERMARPWLDLARYADSQGYEKDARRTQWPYRDWVVDAFNANLPFDRFTVLQLAGDLVEGAGPRELVATGFHRNTMLNEEGGTDEEEFRSDAVLDRVNTTSAVWLGSTLACAQCHDHKYDPFSQREYFQLYAIFNSTADGGRASAPQLGVLDPHAEAQVAALQARAEELERQLAAADEAFDAEQASWERSVAEHAAPPVAWSVLRPAKALSSSQREVALQDDGSVLARGEAPATEVLELSFDAGELAFDALQLEALRDPSLPAGGPGGAPGGNFVLSSIDAYVLRAGGEQERVNFVAAEASYEQGRGNYRAAHSIDPSNDTGWAVGGAPEDVALFARFSAAKTVLLAAGDRLHLVLKHVSPNAGHSLGRVRVAVRRDALARELADAAILSPWRFVGPFPFESKLAALHAEPEPQLEHLAGRAHAPSYGGGLAWSERPEYADRVPQRFDGDSRVWFLERRIVAARARPLELFVGADDALRLWLNGVLVAQSDQHATLTDQPLRLEVPLRAGENRVLLKVVNFDGPSGFVFDTGWATSERVPQEVAEILAARERTHEQKLALRDHFRRQVSARGRELAVELDRARAEAGRLRREAPTVLVMQERAEARSSHVFRRGSFLSPGEAVTPAVPAALGTLDIEGVPPRLAFARWLVSRENPLAARVHVNRLWEWLFGRGLVATSDDFGSRGDAPSHPELLDWLAVELVESGWDQKALLARIVNSATYRQSSEVGAAAYEADPRNELLARGARYRVEAELLRDIALEASGLLVKRLGGPSVMPPQPPGVWRSAYSSDDWVDAQGEERFRRGLYTFWKRTAPYLTFTLFEAPSREVACTRREPTNTPLQALALLDDPAFVEASYGLALRTLREAEGDEARLAFAFRSCTSRRPSANDSGVLFALLDDARTSFRADPVAAKGRVDAARAFVAGDGREHDAVELAAWMSVASVLLNLDETQTRR